MLNSKPLKMKDSFFKLVSMANHHTPYEHLKGRGTRFSRRNCKPKLTRMNSIMSELVCADRISVSYNHIPHSDSILGLTIGDKTNGEEEFLVLQQLDSDNRLLIN